MPCKRCKREAVARIQEMRRRRMVKGLCIYCGIEEQEPDHWGCRPCLNVKRAKRPHAIGKLWDVTKPRGF